MEKEKVNIAILQMSSIIADVKANCEKVKNIISSYDLSKTDTLVLPEVWSCGWSCSDFVQTAVDYDSNYIYDFLSMLSKQYDVNIIGGSIITKKGCKYYNTCPVFDRNGNLVSKYDKMHLYSYYGCDEGKYITSGDTPVIAVLDGIKYGLTICYDIRFPELYRAYARSGVDILVNCAAWGSNKPVPWEMMTKSRAIENQCYMIALTQCGLIKDDEFNLGESRIIDYKGEELNSINHEEGIVCADLDLCLMYDFRSKCTVLNDIKNNYEVKELCVK